MEWPHKKIISLPFLRSLRIITNNLSDKTRRLHTHYQRQDIPLVVPPSGTWFGWQTITAVPQHQYILSPSARAGFRKQKRSSICPRCAQEHLFQNEHKGRFFPLQLDPPRNIGDWGSEWLLRGLNGWCCRGNLHAKNCLIKDRNWIRRGDSIIGLILSAKRFYPVL